MRYKYQRFVAAMTLPLSYSELQSIRLICYDWNEIFHRRNDTQHMASSQLRASACLFFASLGTCNDRGAAGNKAEKSVDLHHQKSCKVHNVEEE